jgi:hypothetical protein
MPDRMRRLAGPYRWQASSHPDLCSGQYRQGCASSLWEQPSFLLGICPTACGAWQGPIAGKPAPTQTSAAINVGRAAQAAYGSNLLFYSVYTRPHGALGRALSLASQLPHRPPQPSMSAGLRKQLMGATFFSTRTCSTACGAWQGLSLASQLPPRPPQPSMSAGLCKRLMGATVFSTRYMPDRMRRLAAPYRWQASSHPDLRSRQCRQGCASSLWEQPSFLLGIYPTACGAWQGPIAGKPAPTQTFAAVNVGRAA